jgi:hypothetical protein
MTIQEQVAQQFAERVRNRMMKFYYGIDVKDTTIEVECEIIETNLLNSQNMQPSEIHLRKELALCKETKGAEAKKRAKEIEKLLGIDKKIEKATIATDEQSE